MKKDLLIEKKQTAIEIEFNVVHLRRLLKIYSLDEIKQIGFQLMDFSLDAMSVKVEEKKGKRFVKIKDTDLYY